MPTPASPSFSDLRRSIAAGNLAPVYLLHGREGYYIDRLVEDFEALVPEEERDFNLYVFYGADADPDRVAEACRRYPMMAERVVVILKEAQAMRADAVNRLASYIESPVASTVFVLAFRGDKAKGRDIPAAIKKGRGVAFESVELKDYNVGPVISGLVKEKGLTIEPKGLTMLRDYIGTDVAMLYNEIDKLALILGAGAMITPEAIERNIGISKDFNSFELVDALAARDSAKVFRIIGYFRANPKNNPTVMVTATLFSFFSTLIILQFCPDKSPSALMAAAGFRQQWQLKKYEPAMRNYNAFQTMEIIAAIREFDTRSKGVGSRQNEYDLLHDLMFHILTAQGKIEIQ